MAKKHAGILRQIEQTKTRIAKERDKLRYLIEDAEAVEESCNEAVASLESAADALSQYL